MTDKDILNCRCDEGKFCEVHQSDCDLHAYLCADAACTCTVISKEESKRLKNILTNKTTNTMKTQTETTKEINKVEHTQGEWNEFSNAKALNDSDKTGYYITDKDGYIVAECPSYKGTKNAKANAERIVKCCNSHDSLVAALQEVNLELECIKEKSTSILIAKNIIKSALQKAKS